MSACPSCNSQLPAGVRWCPICHTNAIDPQFGRLASPARRLCAFILDYLVVSIVLFVTPTVGDPALAAILFVAYAVFALVFFARGATPGKMLLGTYVTKENGQRAGFFTMLFREVIGKFISSLVFGLGFLWIVIDGENQGWHDKFMSTYVVRKY